MDDWIFYYGYFSKIQQLKYYDFVLASYSETSEASYFQRVSPIMYSRCDKTCQAYIPELYILKYLLSNRNGITLRL